MKLACQESMVKGANLGEKIGKLEQWGFEGIEFWGGGLEQRAEEIKSAVEGTAVRVSTICAGYPGCPLDPDPEVREQALSKARDLLVLAGELGAVGLIFVPIFGGPRLPNLAPFADAIELEKLLLAEICKDLAATAAQHGVLLLLEPLNGYESHLLKSVGDALEIIERAGRPEGLALMADFYHMNLVEQDIPEALQSGGEFLQHIHLGDTPRWLPGLGRTDFRPGLAKLAEMGYEKFMALEAGIPGDSEELLPRCVEFVRSQMP